MSIMLSYRFPRTFLDKSIQFLEPRLDDGVVQELESKYLHETQSGGATAVCQAIHVDNNKVKPVFEQVCKTLFSTMPFRIPAKVVLPMDTEDLKR